MTKPLSNNAIAVYKKLYLASVLNETNPSEAHRRVARFAASAEPNKISSQKLEKVYFQMMEKNQFRANTPAMLNAGLHPKPQTSACFVGDLQDDMYSILDFDRDAAIIYKSGSGIGGNYGMLRETNANLSTGGRSSGPFAFLRKSAMTAHAVKSGGSCLAPYQPVFTNFGIKPIQDLVGRTFAILSFDKKEHRFKAKKAKAFMTGNKPIYILKTDQGEFHLTKDHSVLLSTGEYVEVQDLKPGMSLQKFHTSNCKGYVRVQLWDGMKSRRSFHRMIAEDIFSIPANMVVHHKDRDKTNNHFENLQFVMPSKHAKIHNDALVDIGVHPFQTSYLGKPGSANPMHSSAEFWKNEEKVKAYKAKQRANVYKDPTLNKQRALRHHKTAMVARVHEMINSGLLIRDFSFEDLLAARRKKWGRSGASKKIQMESIVSIFGNFENFKQEVNNSNHAVVSVTALGSMPVYDIEVQCGSPNDLGLDDSHNFGISPIDSTGFYGEGIVVHNSRRAAHMAMMTDTHPDLLKFITIKADSDEFVILPNGQKTPLFSAMNLSVAASDAFMKVIKVNGKWDLIGVVDGKVKDTLPARWLFEQIYEAAWKNGDPGIWFIDRANADNTVPSLGRILTTNPCGEQNLLPRQACSLGSINAAAFVLDGAFNWPDFQKAVRMATRFLDNCIDLSGYPTPEYERIALETRPIGLGIMGFADALILMGLKYDSNEARIFAESLAKVLTSASITESAILARQKGAFPLFAENREAVLDVVSKFIHGDEVLEQIKKFGVRNSHWTTIAPTGTTSLSCDCSQGMEPLFAICYDKTLSDSGEVWTFVNPIFEKKFSFCSWYPKMIKKIAENHGSIAGLDLPREADVFVTAHDIHWKDRIDMQAALQKGISNAISSTINLPNSSTPLDIRKIYLYAWEKRLKGITVYRDGCKDDQPVSFGSKAKPAESKTPKPTDRPKIRSGFTHEVKTGHGKVYLTVNCDDHGHPMEIFTNGGKNGSVNAANLEAMARLVSIALQEGVEPERLARTIENINDGTIAWDKLVETDEKAVPIISVPDAIGKVLRQFYCSTDSCTELSSKPIPEPVRPVRRCETCNSPTYMHDGCEFCPNCGSKCG